MIGRPFVLLSTPGPIRPVLPTPPRKLRIEDGTYREFMRGRLENLHISINGEKMERVVAYDQDAGIVERIAMRDGKPIRSGPGWLVEIVEGDVKVELR